jgi:hypothetical protein
MGETEVELRANQKRMALEHWAWEIKREEAIIAAAQARLLQARREHDKWQAA